MTGSIVKKGNRYYIIIEQRDAETGERRRKWHSGFRTKKEAEAARTEILSRMQRGIYVEPSRITLNEYLDSWLDSIRASVRHSTHASYSAMLANHFRPRLGSRRVQSLTPADMNGLYADLLTAGRKDGTGGLSSRSVRYVHTIVRHALSDAVSWGVVARNVADLATPPRHRASASKEMQTWSAEEVSAFLVHSSQDRLSAIWVLAVTTGMRRGELLGLKWKDIDFERSALSVRRSLVSVEYELAFSTPKTEKSRRVIALDTTTLGALAKHRRSQAAEKLAFGPGYEHSDLVFCQENGEPFHPDRLTKVFRAIVQQTELPVIRLHDLRHTHATLALQAGIHPKVVSERLGHSTVAMTLDTYSHTVPSMQSDAAERIAELVFGVSR